LDVAILFEGLADCQWMDICRIDLRMPN